MAEQDLVVQADRAASELRVKHLVKELLRNSLEETLTVCAVLTAVVAMVVFGFQ